MWKVKTRPHWLGGKFIQEALSKKWGSRTAGITHTKSFVTTWPYYCEISLHYWEYTLSSHWYRNFLATAFAVPGLETSGKAHYQSSEPWDVLSGMWQTTPKESRLKYFIQLNLLSGVLPREWPQLAVLTKMEPGLDKAVLAQQLKQQAVLTTTPGTWKPKAISRISVIFQ